MKVFISAEIEKGHNNYVLSQKENDQRTERLEKQLLTSGFRYTKVKGKYKGREETSLLLEITGFELVKRLRAIATAYQQETILVINGNKAFYVNEDGAYIDGGLFKTTSIDNIKKLESYTVLNSVQVAYVEQLRKEVGAFNKNNN